MTIDELMKEMADSANNEETQNDARSFVIDSMDDIVAIEPIAWNDEGYTKFIKWCAQRYIGEAYKPLIFKNGYGIFEQCDKYDIAEKFNNIPTKELIDELLHSRYALWTF